MSKEISIELETLLQIKAHLEAFIEANTGKEQMQIIKKEADRKLDLYMKDAATPS